VWEVDTSAEPRFQQPLRQFSLIGLFVAVTLVALFCGLFMALLRSVTTPRSEATLMNCRSNLRNIGVALAAYHAVHRSYPPLVTQDASGRPLHGWRTHILTHIEREDLAEQYDWNQPWDGPTNTALLDQEIKLFRCRSDRSSPNSDVSYLAIMTPDYKPGDRFVVVEVPRSGVNFFEPRDLTLDELKAAVSNGTFGATVHRHNSVHVLWKDGAVELVKVKDLAGLRKKMGR
jgi:hypothetical protein